MPGRISQLNLDLPYGLGGVTIDIGQAEREAAWKLYVEFSTRCPFQKSHPPRILCDSMICAIVSLDDWHRGSVLVDLRLAVQNARAA